MAFLIDPALLFVEILSWFVAMGWLAYRQTTASIETKVDRTLLWQQQHPALALINCQAE